MTEQITVVIKAKMTIPKGTRNITELTDSEIINNIDSIDSIRRTKE